MIGKNFYARSYRREAQDEKGDDDLILPAAILIQGKLLRCSFRFLDDKIAL